MANELKSEAFNVEINHGYVVDTSLGDVPATLPDPSINEGTVCIFNDGGNNVPLLGYNIEGVSGFKILPNDRLQLLIFNGEYVLGSSTGYHITATKSWRLTIDDETGNHSYVQTNI